MANRVRLARLDWSDLHHRWLATDDCRLKEGGPTSGPKAQKLDERAAAIGALASREQPINVGPNLELELSLRPSGVTAPDASDPDVPPNFVRRAMVMEAAISLPSCSSVLAATIPIVGEHESYGSMDDEDPNGSGLLSVSISALTVDASAKRHSALVIIADGGQHALLLRWHVRTCQR